MKRRLFLAVSLLISFVQFCSSGLTGLSLKIPFISLERRPPLPTLVEGVYEHPVPEQHHIDHHPEVYHSPLHTHSNHGDHFHSDDHKSHHLHGDHHHHNILDHSHVDEQGKLYLHDPESTVKFFYKENMHGPSNLVDVHTDDCREVPLDYWYNRPKSLWAKHCITIYQSGHCKGRGIQVAGSVLELRSAGMHYGVNSFKPCEKNIRIRFLPSVHHKTKHHHHTSHR